MPSKRGVFSLARMGRALLDLAFPRLCLACGNAFGLEEGAFCSPCLRKIGWLNPPFCPDCGEPERACNGHRHKGPLDGVWAYAWHQGFLAEIIADYKYNKVIGHGAHLAAFMLRHSAYWQDESFDIIAPVPLHSRRLRKRGFNQAALLARAFKMPGVKCDLLFRTQFKPPQVGLMRNERALNVKGVFALNPVYDVRGLSILLLDDVWTTGATMEECARTLKKAGAARVAALTLTRTPLE